MVLVLVLLMVEEVWLVMLLVMMVSVIVTLLMDLKMLIVVLVADVGSGGGDCDSHCCNQDDNIHDEGGIGIEDHC